MPSNPKVTIEFCRAHGLRHDYTRNMMGLDKHHARDTHEGWVVLGKNEVWLRHEGHSVILAATGPSWLVKNGATICEGARLEPGALLVDSSSAKMLFAGVTLPAAHAGPGAYFAYPGGNAAQFFMSVWLK